MNLSPFKTKASALTLLFQKPALHGTHRKFYYLRAGQLVSGVLGEPISPKKLIFLGLSLTVLMNLCIPFCRNPYQMLVVWCFNGFAQSFLWPLLISFWGWRTVFFFSAICGIIMILVWNRYCEDAPVISIENASIQGSSQKNSFLSPLLLCIMLTIVLQGMLRDGSPPGCPLIFPKPTI